MTGLRRFPLRGTYITVGAGSQPPERPDRPAWFTDDRRRCAPTNPDWRLWTSENKVDHTLAAGLCHRCPFYDACRAWAVAAGEDANVWGGLNLNTATDRAYAQRLATGAPAPADPTAMRGAELRDHVRELWGDQLPDGEIAVRVGRHPDDIRKLRRTLGLANLFARRRRQAVAS